MPPTDSRPLTCLQDFLNQVKNRPKHGDIPSLPQSLLLRTRNSRRHSLLNNDLLEFLGDRCVNLVTALLVDAVRINKDHHMAVRRVICNNDTFGRLSFYLRFHEHALLDPSASDELDNWNPLSKESPPKALADLFEAYAGAVYLQHGWKKLYRWLRILFEPIIKVATRDFWYRNLPRGIQLWHINRGDDVRKQLQSKFLDYLDYKTDLFVTKGHLLCKSLPASTSFTFSPEGLLEGPHCDEIEVASHLLCMWTCKTFIRLWPRYHQATAKAPHLATAITDLIVNDVTMSFIATAMGMEPFIRFRKVTDEGGNSSTTSDTEIKRTAFNDLLHTVCSRTVLASSFKAAIGIYYRADPVAATDFGMLLLHPLVLRAHDIAVQDPWYRPVMPPSAKEDHDAAPVPTPSSAIHDPISALVDGLQSISIAGSSTPSTDGNDSADARTADSSPLIGPCPSALPGQDQNSLDMTEDRSNSKQEADMSGLIGQLHSLGLAESSNEKGRKALALDDLFDRATHQEEDRQNGNQGIESASESTRSKRHAAGHQLFGSEEASDGPSPGACSVNNRPVRPPIQQRALSDKWRPIGTSQNIPRKPDPNTLSDSTNLSENALSVSAGHRSSKPCSGLGVQDHAITDSGYAAQSSSAGSKSPANDSERSQLKSSPAATIMTTTTPIKLVSTKSRSSSN